MARHGISVWATRNASSNLRAASPMISRLRQTASLTTGTLGHVDSIPPVQSRIRSQHARMWIKYRRGCLAGMVSESFALGEDPGADVRVNRAAFDHVDFGP